MSIRIMLKNRVQFIRSNDLTIIFRLDGTRDLTFYAGNKELLDALRVLATQGGEEVEFFRKLEHSQENLARFAQFIHQFKTHNLLDYRIEFFDGTWVVVVPLNDSFLEPVIKPLPNQRLIFSRFTWWQRRTEGISLSNPLASFEVLMHNDLFIKIFMSFENSSEDFIKEYPHNQEELFWLINLLIAEMYIHPIKYEEPSHLVTWEFHDLLFHSRSRLGMLEDSSKIGGNYRFQKVGMQLPQRNVVSNCLNIIPLNAEIDPSEDEVCSFIDVLRRRRSKRIHSPDNPISKNQLGRFLQWTMKTQRPDKSSPSNSGTRLYPSPGGIYGIELYVVINRCDSIDRGFYYYDSIEHQLHQLAHREHHLSSLIHLARSAMNAESDPQILFIFASQFGRIAWKYQKMAYRTTLMTVGAIFQTMYLVATAMNLAPCALGLGDSHLFSKISGLNPWEQGAVGEFALGS